MAWQPGFARGGEWDTCPPSAALATALEAASGPEWRAPGASHDELFGLLRQWAALESWAVAAKLGILRALIREEGLPFLNGPLHGDLPDSWPRSLTHEVALALAMPAQSAEKLMQMAWNLQARLPGIGSLLADGTLTFAKARAVADEFELLSDEDTAAAEALVMAGLAGDEAPKTYGQLAKLAARAAVTVDPEITARRREHAEREQSRVSLWREQSGAVGLAGRDLPADEALAADANVKARAQEYKASGAFGAARMDQLRAMAYLDLLNGVTTATRIARARAVAEGAPQAPANPGEDPAPGGDPAPEAAPGNPGSNGESPGRGKPDDDSPGDDSPDSDPPGDGSPGGGGPASDGGPGGPGAARLPEAPRLTDLILPLATLLGLAERPGEGYGLGPLDPDLCRALAAAATGSPLSTLCVTVTDPDGIITGHGCARPPGKRNAPVQHLPAQQPVAPPGSPAALPSRLNLTITSTLLARLAGMPGPRAPAPWRLTRADDPGPPGGYGTWTLTLPDGGNLIVVLGPVPTFGCDHRHESHAYQPNDTLRHLVHVRDQECTFPTCSRHARESDFEHALPYHRGGRTCACNAGARSRRCHQVKQSPGWNLTQPRPGWHQWETPSGRTYTQGPRRYPV